MTTTALMTPVVAFSAIGLVALSGSVQQFEPYTETIEGTVVTFDMMPVPAGKIDLPSGEQVAVNAFWIGKTEVTWDEYDVWQLGLDHEPSERRRIDAESRPSRPYGAPDWGYGHAGYATLSVTAHAAEEYAKWLSEKTSRSYRLPTATEWRYACLAGSDSAGVNVHGPQPLPENYLEQVAWHAGNADRTTHPVASKEPNGLGLHDMLGNAGEWAILRSTGVTALHGGTFLDGIDAVHCGTRAEQTRAWNSTDPQIPKSTWWLSDGPFAGFRVVRDPEAAESVR